MRLAVDYGAYLRSAVAECDAGLWPLPAGFPEFSLLRQREGRGLVRRYASILHPPPCLSASSLERVAGQGLLMGQELVRHLRIEDDLSAEISDLVGLANIFMTSFDFAVDEGGPVDRRILALPQALRRMLEDPEAPSSLVSRALEDQPGTSLAFSLRLMECVFRAAWNRAGSRVREHAWRSLAAVAVQACETHLASTGTWDQAERPAPQWKQMRIQATGLCAEMLTRLVLLFPRASAPPGDERAVRVMALVGEAFGWVDDLVDLPRDVAERRMNAILGLSGTPVFERLAGSSPHAVVGSLLATGAVRQAVLILDGRLRAIQAEARKMFSEHERFRQQLLLWLAGWLAGEPEGRFHAQIDASSTVRAAVGFLASSRTADGGYRTEVRTGTDRPGESTESVYLHAFIISGLSALGAEFGVDHLVEAGKTYLRAQEEPPGWWRFYGKSSALPPADVDDTAVALHALGDADLARCWVSSLSPFRTEGGLCRTWADEQWNAAGFHLPDAAVNANLLFLESAVNLTDPQVERFLTHVVAHEAYGAYTVYPATPLAMPYLVSRCMNARGTGQLAAKASMLVEHVLRRRGADGLWGSPFESAMALSTLLNAGYGGAETNLAMARLIECQEADGAWAWGAFFRDLQGSYFGSRCFTASLVLGVLSRLCAVAKEAGAAAKKLD